MIGEVYQFTAYGKNRPELLAAISDLAHAYFDPQPPAEPVKLRIHARVTPQSLLYAGTARPEIRGYEADVTASLYFDNEDS